MSSGTYILGCKIVILKSKKEDPTKETKFGEAQVVDIIFRHWFLIDPIFQLLESKNEDEKEDNSSIKLDPNMKHKGFTPSLHVALFGFDSPPQTQ